MKSLPDLKTLWRLALTQGYWRLRLKSLGKLSVLYRPVLVAGARHIAIGTKSSIRDFARLEVIAQPDVPWTPALTIGDNVNIEQGVHIVCHCEVTIGNNVSITPYCVIVDVSHPYDPPDGSKIGGRIAKERSYVRIGEGTFVGAHSLIMQNVQIGKGCVIGANSVVTGDVPDYCVIVGSPARLVRRFDPNTRQWKSFTS